jgi:hypothetical protein
MQRSKGHRWERLVAQDLTIRTGFTHKRVLNETRDGNCGDVGVRDMPFIYQCKCGARPDVFGAVEEACMAAGLNFPVAAIHRTGRGGEKIAALPWEDWLEIVAMLAERFRK